MKLPVWVHHVGTSYVGSPLGPDDNQVPAIGEVWGKVFDGLNFMSTWDAHNNAINGLQKVVQRDKMHQLDGGREWKPWGVVRGRQPGWSGNGYALQEGKLAAETAKAGAGQGEPNVIILDVEPYYHGGATPQFWRNDLGADANTVKVLLDTFLANGGEEVWLSLDAREAHLDPISFDAWMEYKAVTRFLPQTYWTDFKKNWRTSITTANVLLNSRGVPNSMIHHVMPGNAKPEELSQAIDFSYSVGNGIPSIWQRLNFSPEAAALVAKKADPWMGSPVPDPSGFFLTDREFEDIGNKIENLDERTATLQSLLAQNETDIVMLDEILNIIRQRRG